MASLSASITQGCDTTGGVLTLTQASPAPGAGPNLSYSWTVLDATGNDYGGTFDVATLPVYVPGLANDTYRVRVRAVDPDDGAVYSSQPFTLVVSCGAPSGGLLLDAVSHTDETAAGANDGTVTIQASGGVGALTAELRQAGVAVRTLPATSGTPTIFQGITPGPYTPRVSDSATPTPNFVEASVDVAAFVAPVVGCLDEYAEDYDPDATQGGACTYAAGWRAAWQDVAVAVPALVGQVDAYATALLRIGFRPGHPEAANRPLGNPVLLRATIGPDGYATFRLGPYLRPALGAPDGRGGRRLDLNSPDAYAADLYVGFELRRPDGSLLGHGYALNAAVPDAQLTEGLLTPFPQRLPVWPGFDDYQVAHLAEVSAGRYGIVENDPAYQYTTVMLPCPSNPVPVAWLAPGGGFGFWVFQGRPELGDEVEEGQSYNEAGTFERRYSERGTARRTVSASSGVFKGRDLMDGLRTLWASPQVWYRPDPAGPWVPVTIDGGGFPAGRLGLSRQQVSISFTEAAPRYAQGQ